MIQEAGKAHGDVLLTGLASRAVGSLVGELSV
jgi:hypothetical protein